MLSFWSAWWKGFTEAQKPAPKRKRVVRKKKKLATPKKKLATPKRKATRR